MVIKEWDDDEEKDCKAKASLKVIAISDSKLHLDVNSLLAQCNMAGLCTIVEVTYYRNGPATTNLHDMWTVCTVCTTQL